MIIHCKNVLKINSKFHSHDKTQRDGHCGADEEGAEDGDGHQRRPMLGRQTAVELLPLKIVIYIDY